MNESRQSAPAIKNLPGTALVGCAGWSLTREVAPSFPVDGSQLERYAAVFGAVEINSSFYRPHQPKTYARWAASVPDDFRFSVKLPRTITHQHRLVDIDALLARFAGEAGELGEKLGCVLVQMPPSLVFESEIAAAFMQAVRDTFAGMVACEARHPSWFGVDADSLLQQQRITRVIADPAAGQPGPHVPTTAASYMRLHGSPHVYYSPYADDYLAQLSAQLARHAAAGRPAWLIFDNTAAGASLPNALTVRRPGAAR